MCGASSLVTPAADYSHTLGVAFHKLIHNGAGAVSAPVKAAERTFAAVHGSGAPGPPTFHPHLNTRKEAG